MKEWISFRKKDGTVVRREVSVLYPRKIYQMFQKIKEKKEANQKMIDDAVQEVNSVWQEMNEK